MLIGIDGNEANIKNRVGVGRYAFELLRQFFEIRNSKLETRNKSQILNSKFQIYLKNKPLEDLPRETEWWKYKIVGPRKLWTQIALPLTLMLQRTSVLKQNAIDVFFTPNHYGPRFCPCPSVIAVMDLSFLRYPEMFKTNDLYQLKNWTAYSVKKAAKVLTISQSSKNDIIKYYGVEKKKVVVTYPGITMQNDNSKLKIKYGIDGNYILSVGTLQPRKNYVKLIGAFSKIQDDSLELVIVGKKGWLYEEILAAPKKYGVEDKQSFSANKVKFLDYVADEDLPDLYRNASCFVLISLYEGFGLPVLEAMAYGCPVIVGNVSSLPEVVGEAGILVDPNNTEEITDKLLMILRMPKKEREEMIKKGQEQAKKFSWEKCAQETLSVLEEIGGKHI